MRVGAQSAVCGAFDHAASHGARSALGEALHPLSPRFHASPSPSSLSWSLSPPSLVAPSAFFAALWVLVSAAGPSRPHLRAAALAAALAALGPLAVPRAAGRIGQVAAHAFAFAARMLEAEAAAGAAAETGAEADSRPHVAASEARATAPVPSSAWVPLGEPEVGLLKDVLLKDQPSLWARLLAAAAASPPAAPPPRASGGGGGGGGKGFLRCAAPADPSSAPPASSLSAWPSAPERLAARLVALLPALGHGSSVIVALGARPGPWCEAGSASAFY